MIKLVQFSLALQQSTSCQFVLSSFIFNFWNWVRPSADRWRGCMLATASSAAEGEQWWGESSFVACWHPQSHEDESRDAGIEPKINVVRGIKFNVSTSLSKLYIHTWTSYVTAEKKSITTATTKWTVVYDWIYLYFLYMKGSKAKWANSEK